MSDRVSLRDLGVEEDPGTEWHPSGLLDEVRMLLGDLPDLDDNEVGEHMRFKRRGFIDEERLLEAEDSTESPEGAV